MQIDVLAVLVDYNNRPIFWSGNDGILHEKMTVRSVILDALNNTAEKDPVVKKQLFDLSLKVASNDVVSLDLSEISLLKSSIDARCKPLVLGRMYEAISPSNKQKKEPEATV